MRFRALATLPLLASLACAGGARTRMGSPREPAQPRVGELWSVAAGRSIAWPELERRARAARFVLLGEVHDNPVHHRLEARVIAALATSPRPPAVVFEMLDRAQQSEVDAFLAEGRRDPDAFAARVGWAESGWPEFALYRPVFAAVLEGGLPILAAGLPRGAMGRDEPPAGWRERFGLAEPLPPAEQAHRLEEMFESHCELIPREQLGPMVTMQRARDARMADALLRGAEARGQAVLVAGSGHARRPDVPELLERAGTARSATLSIGFLEVDPEPRRLEDPEVQGFDVAVFTATAEREDPCERLRRRLAP